MIIKGSCLRHKSIISINTSYFQKSQYFDTLFVPREYSLCRAIYSCAKLLANITSSGKLLLCVSDDAPSYEELSVWWNDSGEIIGDRNRACLAVDDLVPKEGVALVKRVVFPAILTSARTNRLRRKCTLCGFSYIGAIEDLYTDYRSALWEDKPMCSTEKSFRDFNRARNYSRIDYITYLQENLGAMFNLYGSGWESYGLMYEPLHYDPDRRMRIYRQSLAAVDFLSKSGNTCLYERTVEILNSGTLLVQRTSYDSIRFFGEEFVSLLSFDSKERLSEILELLVNDSGYYIAATQAMNQARENARQMQRAINTKLFECETP